MYFIVYTYTHTHTHAMLVEEVPMQDGRPDLKAWVSLPDASPDRTSRSWCGKLMHHLRRSSATPHCYATNAPSTASGSTRTPPGLSRSLVSNAPRRDPTTC